MTPPRNGTWALGAVVTIALATSTVAVASRFLPDNPIVTDPESHDASRVKPRTSMASMSADVTRWLESRGRSRGQGPIRAMNVNTIDEVPDSSWFTNRPPDPGRLTVEVPDDGENRVDRTREDSANRWTITAAEGTQRLVRLNVRDTLGVGHVLTFEAPAHAERTTGATMLTVTLLGAAGYNAPTHHLIRVKRGQLAIDPIALVSDQFGHRRRMTTTDLGLLLARTARHTDGSYRVVARRQPDGVDLGPFTYAGTRRDDPNDLFPHEHHRELRGLKVFAAWLNHDAPAAFGTRDVLVDANGRQLVRHWLVELGATLGSGSALAERAPAGNEDAWRNRPKLRTLLTLGLAVRPWVKVPYPDLPSVGQFEATFFDPSSWIPPYSNAAFDNARADDLFWAARRVASFSNSAIRAAVQAGQYSESSGRSVPRRSPHRSARQNRHRLAERCLAAGGLPAGHRWMARLHQRRRACDPGPVGDHSAARRGAVSGAVVSVRQRHRRSESGSRGTGVDRCSAVCHAGRPARDPRDDRRRDPR